MMCEICYQGKMVWFFPEEVWLKDGITWIDDTRTWSDAKMESNRKTNILYPWRQHEMMWDALLKSNKKALEKFKEFKNMAKN